jgi:threonine synthase
VSWASSHPVGVHAHRTIAYEVAEALRWVVPDWVVVPVSRGDGLFGIWSDFAEMTELGWTDDVPKMLAVERYPTLTDALARGLEQPVAMDVQRVGAASSLRRPRSSTTLRRFCVTGCSTCPRQSHSWVRPVPMPSPVCPCSASPGPI